MESPFGSQIDLRVHRPDFVMDKQHNRPIRASYAAISILTSHQTPCHVPECRFLCAAFLHFLFIPVFIIIFLFMHVSLHLLPAPLLFSLSITVLQRHAQASRGVQRRRPPGDPRRAFQFTGCQVKKKSINQCSSVYRKTKVVSPFQVALDPYSSLSTCRLKAISLTDADYPRPLVFDSHWRTVEVFLLLTAQFMHMVFIQT